MNNLFINYFIIRYFRIVLSKLLKFITGDIAVSWNVIIGSFDENFNLTKRKIVKNPKNSYLADPFIFETHDKTYIFVEELPWDTQIGKISLLELDNFKVKYIGPVLEESFHLSFPFIFQKENTIYMIPETHKNAHVSIYKSTQFPYKWRFSKHIIKNICASDTVLFKKNNFYYALTNNETGRFGDRNTNLTLYKTNKFENDDIGEFEKVSEIYSDASKARNAGLFIWENKYYRVNQVHSFNMYGKNAEVSEIFFSLKDGCESYNEIENKNFQKLLNDAKEGFIGCHHFHVSQSNNFFVCDGSSIEFKRYLWRKFDYLIPKMLLPLKIFILNIK